MRQSILIIGASRGLGHAMAAEFLRHGWHVTGTVRGASRTPLHALADDHPDQLDIDSLDMCEPAQVAGLRARLAGRHYDILFVNAGVSNNPADTIADVTTEEFNRVMLTNALSPMRVIETLGDLVTPSGLIGIMSSGQGSVANNANGQRELYRGSKAALNMFMRSYAARHASSQRPMVLMAPGWVRTELGGQDGRLAIGESIPGVVRVLLDKQRRPGLEYLDYLGRTVPW